MTATLISATEAGLRHHCPEKQWLTHLLKIKNTFTQNSHKLNMILLPEEDDRISKYKSTVGFFNLHYEQGH